MKRISHWFWQKFGDEVVDGWYYALAVTTYFYMAFLNFNFFWENSMLFAFMGAALVEAYLAAVNRYIELKKVRREFDKKEAKTRKKRLGYVHVAMWAASAIAVIATSLITRVVWDVNNPQFLTGLVIIVVSYVVVEKFLGVKLIHALEEHLNMRFNNNCKSHPHRS